MSVNGAPITGRRSPGPRETTGPHWDEGGDPKGRPVLRLPRDAAGHGRRGTHNALAKPLGGVASGEGQEGGVGFRDSLETAGSASTIG
jgi:hypothetical protein